MTVYLALFDKDALSVDEKLTAEYENYAEERIAERRELLGFEIR